MKTPPSFGLKSCRTRQRLPSFLFVGIVIAFANHALATGDFGPTEYLAQGGNDVVTAPEFYWELEVKRLAKDFHPTEKPIPVTRTYNDSDTPSDQAPLLKATATADTTDFADALKTGEIKPPDATKATQSNNDARAAIAATPPTPMPAEFDSEFADYHRGAYAYKLGKDHWDEAKKAWEALLNRPATERHYRTIWATFMLGKLAMKRGEYADAVKDFEKTRELAKQGFADSLGMAADSYGWEGRCEWKQNHPEKAAKLFLTQLALGDESAIVSLKALVPDRAPVDGMLNYGPDQTPEEKQQGVFPPVPPEQTVAGLKQAAQDPLLRKLVTAHILAAGEGSPGLGASPGPANARSDRWLKIINDLKLDSIDDAEYLGWIAYTVGDYKNAQRWLDLCKSGSPAADWLRAKLQLRAGKVDDALKSLSKAIAILRSPDLYTGWTDGAFKDANQGGPGYISNSEDEWTMAECASGDLGGMHLEHGDFLQAMDVLLKGGLWDDASFIAERILTADELKAYVDKLPAPPKAPAKKDQDAPTINEENKNDPDDYTQRLRNLLGRRFVREDRYDEAAKYLTAPYDKIVQKYAADLKIGDDKNVPNLKRAQALFAAAWLARYDGMDLMGTEVAPDGFHFEGDFEDTDLASQRLFGTYTVSADTNDGIKPPAKNDVPTSEAERQRLEKNKIEPDKRYHYRYIAAALAMKAAALMKDDTEELADVINTAGNWIKNSDEKLGDRYFQVLEKRAPFTRIGSAAHLKHWFIDDMSGEWSTEQQNAFDAMHKEYGTPDSNGK